MAAMRCAATAVRLAGLLVALCAASVTGTSLRSFGSCPNLLSFYHTNAIKRAYEFASGPIPRIMPLAAPAAPAAPAALAQPVAESVADAPPTAGTDFSDTNVQVAGVDEPDIVKTDGRRIFVVRHRTLFLVRAAPNGAAGYVAAKLVLPTSVSEMLVERDTLLLIGSDFGELDPGKQPPSQPPFFPRPFPVSMRVADSLLGVTATRSSPPIFFGQALTVVYRVSVTDDRLRMRDNLRMQGRYISAREVDGVVRLVTSFRPRFRFTVPRRLRRGQPVPQAAKNAIWKTRIWTWLPSYRLHTPCASAPRNAKCGPVRTGLLVGCDKVYRPFNAFSGFSLLAVTTLRMSGEFVPRGGAGVVSDGQDVYSTATSLYVATTVYENDAQTGPRLGAAFRTGVHKFSLRPWATLYVGSGSVSGSVLNQFSMHEHHGVFYIATTVGAPWWGARDQSKSKITALRQVDGLLKPVGSVGNLGVGERIYAVRYVRTLAYVVTFREVDPLYIVDISKPWQMRVTGELKIPGFSSYLHPIGNGRLLGVGRDATPDGRTTGAKVSLFDVSDLAKPRELAAWTLKGSFSSARWDHRAFLYWAAESVAVLPLDVFANRAGGDFSGSIVLKIGTNSITPKGRVSHPKCCGAFAFQPSIDRNFVLGKTNLWSLSQNALQVNDIRSLRFKKNIKLAPS